MLACTTLRRHRGHCIVERFQGGERQRDHGLDNRVDDEAVDRGLRWNRVVLRFPVAVRSFLHLASGAVLVWSQDGDRIVDERATHHSTTKVHQALFAGGAPVGVPAKTLDELKQGIRQRMQRQHAGHLPLATFDKTPVTSRVSS